jgi:hypothetical protein
MRYLYGDSSSFPLNQNFIVTLATATDCAVALLKVDENISSFKKVSDQANAASMSEIADIDQLTQRLTKALAQREHLSNATAKVAEGVVSTAQAQFAKAKSGIKSWRDGTIRKAQRGCGPADMMAPIHRFMVKQELPYTSWGLRWKAGVDDEPVQAQVYAIMQRGLTSTLSVAIPPKHTWAQPVRIGELIEQQISLKLMGKNWLGRDKLKDFPLDKYFVTRITRTSERHQLILSRKPKDISEGLKISLREGDSKRVQVTRIDEEENELGTPAGLEGADAQLIKRLWRRIEETIADLVRHRHQLLAATLYGKRITELESPATIAVAIIQSIAPLVRDMKRHSRTPGELQLKRDLGDGRREELFIAEQEIIAKFQTLTAKNQQLFDCCGLTTTHVPSEEEVQRAEILSAEILSAEQLHMSLSLSGTNVPAAPASAPASQPMAIEITRPKVSRPGSAEVYDVPAASGSRPSSEGMGMRPQHQQHPPVQPTPMPPPPSEAPISAIPETSPFPTFPGNVGPHSSEFAPPMVAMQELQVPRAPKLPSSIPPPSNPPKRRRNKGQDLSLSSDQVFRLPPPSVPPPKKPVRRRNKSGNRSRNGLKVVNG